MTDRSFTPEEYSKKSSERRERNKNNIQSFRRRLKRKRSLVSRFSMESKASMDTDQRSNNSDCSTPCPSSHLKGDVFASLPSMIVTDFTTDPLTDGNHSDVTSASDDDISMIDTSSSSSASDDDSSEDTWTDSSTNTNLFDDRPLHSHTSSTVHAFSVDLLEFCRVSRLPKNQRSQLLELFRTYLPSQNLVPVSASSLGSKFLTPFIYVHHCT
jgi:hypothetical protein